MTKVRIPNRILELKIFMEKYLRFVNGQIDPDDDEKNEMTI